MGWKARPNLERGRRDACPTRLDILFVGNRLVRMGGTAVRRLGARGHTGALVRTWVKIPMPHAHESPSAYLRAIELKRFARPMHRIADVGCDWHAPRFQLSP